MQTLMFVSFAFYSATNIVFADVKDGKKSYRSKCLLSNSNQTYNLYSITMFSLFLTLETMFLTLKSSLKCISSAFRQNTALKSSLASVSPNPNPHNPPPDQLSA